MTDPDLAALYCETRLRLCELVAAFDDARLATAVPSCPGWSVHDVVAHVTAVVEDALAGRLMGPPDDAQTAEQVARHRATPTAALLGTWAEHAPAFETVVGQFAVWPAVVDVVTHEQDIRGALGVPGARDCEALIACAERATQSIDPANGYTVDFGDGVTRGPDGASLALHTTAFEYLRVCLGRRTPVQAASLDWSADPSPVIQSLFLMGPATAAVIE